MDYILTNLAASGGNAIMEALGIDWLMLGLQVVAFLVLLWFLGKFVYPPIVRMLDKRDEAIEASMKAAREAQQQADNTEAEVARLLKQAQREASDIIAVAKAEASDMVEAADKKAKARAEHIVLEAKSQIDKDVRAAKQALRDETIDLVALATEKVVGKTVDGRLDETIIESALKEASK